VDERLHKHLPRGGGLLSSAVSNEKQKRDVSMPPRTRWCCWSSWKATAAAAVRIGGEGVVGPADVCAAAARSCCPLRPQGFGRAGPSLPAPL